MKKLNAFLVSVLSAAALNAAVIEQVIVRQQWPWSTDVKVEYKLSGVTTPVDISVRAYNGDVELPLPEAAITGNLKGVTEDGVGQFTIDPVAAFGTEKIALANFKVKLSVSDAVLYKVFSLSGDKEVVDITASDLRSGRYGSYEEDYASIMPGSTVGRVLVWTGVTNEPMYKTSHLVMRHIFAKGESYVMGTTDTPSTETKHTVSFTNDFYMSVFPLTVGQVARIKDEGSGTTEEDMKPATGLWTYFRGNFLTDGWLGWWPVYGVWQSNPERFEADPSKSPHDCVLYGTIAYNLREKTGGAFNFDFSTEARWEYACRAGTQTSNYAGSNDDAETVSRIAWYAGNSDGAAHVVGQKCANPWGLYDMLGNVKEWCLDNAKLDPYFLDVMPPDPVVDPMGPDATGRYNPRLVRGGSYASGLDEVASGCRKMEYPHSADVSQLGFRLVFDVY